MRNLIRSSFATLLPALMVVTLISDPCRAGFIVSTTPVVASQGSSGFLEILLTNDSDPARTLSAFSLDVQFGSGVVITAADDQTSVAPFVFGTDGTGTVTFDPLPASFLNVNDVNLVGSVTIGAGETFGLARLAYQVAADAPVGLISVSFIAGPGTQFLSASGLPYPDTVLSLEPGTFEVTAGSGGVIPEPASVVLLSCGIGLLIAVRSIRKIRS